MGRTLILESVHEVYNRSQFQGTVERRHTDQRCYVIAPCGCENSTALGVYNGRSAPTCDGVTVLCDDHAIPDNWDEWDWLLEQEAQREEQQYAEWERFYPLPHATGKYPSRLR